jgi:hypothetical protein
LEQAIPDASKSNPAVSKRGVDWHLEHSLKIINAICKTIAKSNQEDYTPKFSFVKYYILWTGNIPRGKAPSPKPFNNKDAVDASRLSGWLEEAKLSLTTLHNLNPKQHFRHPFFGDLKLKEAKRFITIHTAHHLNIIDDIVKT